MTDTWVNTVVEDTSRLLEYLAAVAREIQVRPVRDFRRLEFVLTPQDVPQHSKIQLGPKSDRLEWIKVPRMEEPSRPELPDQLEGYIELSSLNDLDSSPYFRPELDGFEVEELQELLDEWIAGHWTPWSIRVRPIREARSLYTKLMELRLLIQRQQATHELAWGFSVLGLDTAGGVVAPLLITRVEIQLDEETGALSVIPDGIPELELDSLEGIGLDGIEDLAHLRSQLVSSPPLDPWDVESLDALNRRIVAPLGIDAKASETTELPVGVTDPTVTRAWMLVARPRPARHQRFYDELAQVLRERSFLPESLASVVAVERDLNVALESMEIEETASWQPVGQRLLMPLPTNEEQERIARQLAGSRGVTVQGPPGTGKSHTIVNLVSHLMAHGKRVLVTAQNEQALRVLRDKFPPELQDLTVSVLGSSPAHMDSLRASIQAVLDIASKVDPAAEAGPIRAIGQRLDEVRDNLRRVELRLVEALRDEEAEFPLSGNPSRASDVAIWLSRNQSRLVKIPDLLNEVDACPVTSDQFDELLTLTRQLSPEDIEESDRYRPQGQDLPTSSQLRKESARLNELVDILADLEESGLDLASVAETSLDDLDSASKETLSASQRLLSLQSRWTKILCAEFRSSNDSATYWAGIIAQAREVLKNCQDLKLIQSGHEIRVPSGDPRVQHDMLSELSDRFAFGRGVPKLFKPELRKFFADCRVNDLEPRSVKEIDLLRSEVDLRQKQRQLQRILTEAANQIQLPIPDIGPQFLSTCTQVIKDMEDAQDWETRYKPHLRELLGKYFTDGIDTNNVDALVRSGNLLAKAALQKEAENLGKSFSALETKLSEEAKRGSASASWKTLSSALVERDWQSWQAVMDETERIRLLQPRLVRWHELSGKLETKAPQWLRAIRDSGGDSSISGEPNNVSDAWQWQQAWTWISRLHSKADIESLMHQAHELQGEAERLVIELARRSAAVAVRENLDDEKRRALTSWQQALQKFGKGTGKHAPHWMQVARSQLPIAMGAIPAWIMPIHRVLENFDPRISELFDVVIVDESSQCDLLSVGVLALGKKCVVVGDDKQTSPAAVGVDVQRIRQLQNIYLSGIDQRELLTADESLYSLAERVFPSVILLREHFRCLPEIIRFSNRYYDGRILPLREPPQHDIGEPLRAIRVDGAIRAGATSNAVNHEEAQALVDQVLACNLDPRYEGLTFGVVTLQGNAQAPLIEKLLIEQLGFEAFESRNMRVGSPADFQGDERHVIFISTVADDNRYQAVRVPDKQRINVAASRAQDQLWIFYSMDVATLNHQDQRRALIEYAMDGGKTYVPHLNQLDACESEFERDVLRDIVAKGYEVLPQYPVGSYRIDLVVQFGKKRLAVECDGDRFHGADQYENDLRRQRVLERLGWKFWRVRASEYYLDPGKAMSGLWDRIERLNESVVALELESPEIADHMVTDWEPAVVSASGVEKSSELAVVELAESPEPADEEKDWTAFFGREPDYAFENESQGLWIFKENAHKVTGVPMTLKDVGEEWPGERTNCSFGYGKILVDFIVTQWMNGSGEVHSLDVVSGGPNLNRLRQGGRIGLYEYGGDRQFAEIRVMRLGNKEMATAHNPEPGEIDEILGWSLVEYLDDELGLAQIGSRFELIGDDGRRRAAQIALWEGREVDVPALLYVTTRIVPLMSMDGDY